MPPPRSQSLETFTSKKGFKDENDSDVEDEEDVDDNEVADAEKDNAADQSFRPAAQSTPQPLPPSLVVPLETAAKVYANLGHSRLSLAPSKPQRPSSGHQPREAETSDPEAASDTKTGSVQASLAAMFHAKTSSITGSINSEAMSDSTISFPSSSAGSAGRKAQDGSEADSERDSVSPQRLGPHDTEVRVNYPTKVNGRLIDSI